MDRNQSSQLIMVAPKLRLGPSLSPLGRGEVFACGHAPKASGAKLLSPDSSAVGWEKAVFLPAAIAAISQND